MPRARIAVVIAALALSIVPAVASAAPANDAYAQATPIAVGQTIAATNLGASFEFNEPDPYTGTTHLDVYDKNCVPLPTASTCTSSVWFTFTPASSGQYTLDTCDAGTDFNTIIGLYTGTSLSGLAPVTANDNTTGCIGPGPDSGSRVTFTATAATTYTVEVAGYQAADGVFELRAYAGPGTAALQPDTAIDGGSSVVLRRTFQGSHSGSRSSASFVVHTIPAGSALQCSFDGAPFSSCTSPVSYDAAEGSTHTFAARAVVSGVPDATPARQILTIDHTPPDTSFFRQPSDPSSSSNVDWYPATTERNFGRVQCGLDGASPFGDCATTQLQLCNGTHTFRAAAVDAAGNVDPTPVTQTFTETGGPSTCAAPTTSHPDDDDASANGPTGAEIQSRADPTGQGGLFTIDYGTTTAYGLSVSRNVPSFTTPGEFLEFLAPNTTYHFLTTLKVGTGTLISGDQTLTTDPLTGPLPGATLGAMTAIGNHAATIEIVVPPHVHPLEVGLRIDTSPAVAASPEFDADDTFGPNAAPATVTIPVTDLEPGVYHVRSAVQDETTGAGALGPDTLLAVPAPPPAVVPVIPISSPPPPPPGAKAKAKFKLKASDVTIAKVKHSSTKFLITVRHLPAKTTVTLKLTIGKRKLTVTRKTTKAGTLKITVKLSRTARSALRSHKVKKLTLSVGAKPSGESTTSVSLHPVVKTH